MNETKALVGQILGQGRYHLKRKLGEGGMAFVYLAFDNNVGIDVVLKVPKPDMLSDPDMVLRFKREIRSLVHLSHPHIVRIKDVGDQDGVPFYVMDLLTGGSLEDRFETVNSERKPQPPESLTEWLLPVACALDFIHTRYIHRDIKPANILFDASGNAHVSDFGIVKIVADGTAAKKQTVMTQTGIVIGTCSYIAPEISEGKAYDGRADQYALVATVYEVLSGRVPFDGATLPAIIRQQLTGIVPPIRNLTPTLRNSLMPILEKGLSWEPSNRFATCEAFAISVLASIRTANNVGSVRSKNPVGKPVSWTVCPSCRKKVSLPDDGSQEDLVCPFCDMDLQVQNRATGMRETKADSAPPKESNTSFVCPSCRNNCTVRGTHTAGDAFVCPLCNAKVRVSGKHKTSAPIPSEPVFEGRVHSTDESVGSFDWGQGSSSPRDKGHSGSQQKPMKESDAQTRGAARGGYKSGSKTKRMMLLFFSILFLGVLSVSAVVVFKLVKTPEKITEPEVASRNGASSSQDRNTSSKSNTDISTTPPTKDSGKTYTMPKPKELSKEPIYTPPPVSMPKPKDKLPSRAAIPTGWEQYKSFGSGFKAYFPGRPEINKSRQLGDSESLKVYSSEIRGDNKDKDVKLMVIVYAHESSKYNAPPKERHDYGIETAKVIFKGWNVTINENKETTVDGIRATEFTFAGLASVGREPARGVIRVFVPDTTLIVAGMISYTGAPEEAYLDGFFENFEIIKDKE